MDSKGLEWILERLELEAKQRMEAEKLLMDIMFLSWWRRLFVGWKIYRFFLKRFDGIK